MKTTYLFILALLVALVLAGSVSARGDSATLPTYSCEYQVAGGDTSDLIGAINYANANCTQAWITLGRGTYVLTTGQDASDGANAFPSITTNIALDGFDTVLQRSATAPGFRIFRVAASGRLGLSNLSIEGGYANAGGKGNDGGAILNLGSLMISNCDIRDNKAYESGGAIRNEGTLYIGTSKIRRNVAETNDAGGINNKPTGTVTIQRSEISENRAFEDGGGIENEVSADHVNWGTIQISDSVFSGNSVTGGTLGTTVYKAHGGGIDNEAKLVIRDSVIKGNLSEDDGAGIRSEPVAGSKLEIYNSTIADNVANDRGGGLMIAEDADVIVENCTFYNNRTTDNGKDDGGGGIFNAGTLALKNSTVANSRADSDGGGILTDSLNGKSSATILTNVTVSNNKAADDGGGIRQKSGSTVTLQSTILARNEHGSGDTDYGADCRGNLTIAGRGDTNLIGDPVDCTLAGSTYRSGDAGLGTYEDLGRAGTGYYHLVPDSAAIDHGDKDTCTEKDQIGLARRDGDKDGEAICDIGAIEQHLFVVNTEDDVAPALSCDLPPGDCSLREAINTANSNPGYDVVSVPANTYSLGSTIEVSDDTTIIGGGRESTFIDGSNMFDGSSATTLSFSSREAGWSPRLTVHYQVGDPTWYRPTFEALQDAYITQAKPGENFGGQVFMKVSGDDPPLSGKDDWALIVWDLSTIPRAADVDHVEILLYFGSSPVRQPMCLFPVTGPWFEKGYFMLEKVTWLFSPTWDKDKPISLVNMGDNGYGYEVFGLDSSFVQDWVSGTTSNYGVLLFPGSCSDTEIMFNLTTDAEVEFQALTMQGGATGISGEGSATVNDSRIQNTGCAICAFDAHVVGSEISNNGTGVSPYDAGGAAIEDSQFKANGLAVRVAQSWAGISHTTIDVPPNGLGVDVQPHYANLGLDYVTISCGDTAEPANGTTGIQILSTDCIPGSGGIQVGASNTTITNCATGISAYVHEWEPFECYFGGIDSMTFAGNTKHTSESVPDGFELVRDRIIKVTGQVGAQESSCQIVGTNMDGTREACRIGGYADGGLPGHGHYPLLAGSPGIDVGGTDCSSSDQLGNARTDGDGDGVVGCDIGAVEYQPPAPGNCNADDGINAGDLSAIVNEIFDGDDGTPKTAPFGSFAGTIACDANQGHDRIEAGDLACTVLLIFGGTCGSAASVADGAMASDGMPTLRLAAIASTATGGQATIPIEFSGAGKDIASLAFSLDFDETRFSFDPTDADQDGIPDAVHFTLPPGFTPIVAYDLADTDGELDVVVADVTAPLQALPDGVVAEVTLTMTAPTNTDAPGASFSQSPPASFGNTTGQSVPGSTTNGVMPIHPSTLYLPQVMH